MEKAVRLETLDERKTRRDGKDGESKVRHNRENGSARLTKASNRCLILKAPEKRTSTKVEKQLTRERNEPVNMGV